MAGLKAAFLILAGGGLLVHLYFLLRISPIGFHFMSNTTKRVTSVRSLMTSNASHFEGRRHNSGHVSTTLSPADHRSNCRYKVQVYDRNNKLTLHRPVLQSIVQASKQVSKTQTDIQCSNNCSMEVTIADEKNGFAGMDAVVFHFMKALIPKPQPPADVNPNQTWVYFTWESPFSNSRESAGLRKLPVHATWTYHRASNITMPYGFYRPGVPMANQTKSIDEWMKGKTKLIAWMASNCRGTSWPRTGFVRELKKYIQVDAYGACGNLKCKPSWSTKCMVDLMRRYKFYLSLENAECEDYITEKLWHKPLMQGVVPIVYGPRRQVYEELLPPNSFIYVGDYKNMKELADYLKLLDSKPELYVQYLEWQYKGSVGVPKQMHGSYDPSIFCNLIPVIEKVKRGELKRTPVGKSKFSKSCRPKKKSSTDSKSSFGLGKWNPW